MNLSNVNSDKLYNQLSRPSGSFAMVAVDQRDSLRVMFQQVVKETITDASLIKFKSTVAELLSPFASAMLFDRYYGMDALEVVKKTSLNCGIIVAMDHLVQEPGQAITDVTLDYKVNPHEMAKKGASALKYMFIWKNQQDIQRNIKIAEEFLQYAHSAGLLGIIEVIVRKPDDLAESEWSREDALSEAATTFGALKPDVYKTEVPFHGDAQPSKITEQSELLSNALPCPWVVLSSGVRAEFFSRAVEAACKGGASGFLAGRGIWKDSIRSDEIQYRKELKSISIPRLVELGEIVDSSARPWKIAIQNN
jgi:sulfofructosephosphate aldolase